LLVSYLLGAIPFGLIIVWIANKRDIRTIESGRTGGTNAMRAAGLLAGILTALFDVLKGAATFYVVEWIYPAGGPWLRVAAAVMAVVGHNYSIFLLERFGADNRVRLRGGAGGATCLGGSVALWGSTWMFLLPLAFLVYVLVGYASVTTMSIAGISILIFAYRAAIGVSPWAYVVYGIITELILMWALRPNLKRLREGTERPVGLRAYYQKKSQKPEE
jgi:glycerol-3-phosphate acyltransferase PlsY